ncbi:PQQ-binding-like beta-propeller repeat protein [Halovenus sp. WSH3]|uniref:PQQ-binding-like beta-propeller repeat protein n=1 Tax=Halovenus carboxidivorans TaxID=2692199 RepID=A0A6B0T2L5_9EURY|nr:PQQ-binding-like beta-propeller repeat protein [Halovenus carboxidivorans]MXR50476.1 PQQ-binding-like beta-propeller repeat protein [Halovenus carboxidivorans]
MDSGCTRRELLGTIGTAAVGAAVADGVSAQQSTAEEWPTFGYDRTHTGHNPNGTGVTENPGGSWQYLDAEEAYRASVAVSDGVVYAANRDGNLYAVDATTGELVDGWPVGLGAPSEAPPTVADGTVYVGNESGTVRAIDTDTAELQWRFDTERAVRGAPVVYDGTVYATSTDGSVYAIDAEAGSELWTFDTGEQTTDDVEIRGGPAVVTDGGVTVYAANTGGLVYALTETESGVEEKWERIVPNGQIQTTPVVANGSVYVTAVQSAAGFVYALDSANGQQEWTYETGGAIVAAPAATSNYVYVGARDQFLHAVDVNSGEEQWRFDTGRQINSTPAVVDGTVYVTNFGNDVFALTTEGDERWSTELLGTISASPAVAGGRLYIGSENSGLYALESGADVTLSPGTTTNSTVEDSPLGTPETSPFGFLVLPAAAVTFFGVLAGGLYVLFTSDWAKQFEVEEAPIEKLYEDEEEEPDMPGFDRRSETEVWSVIVGDVISRAEHSETVAREDVIVKKYVDDTLDAPVTAYEIESARDDPVQITISEPVLGEADALADQPLNEGWRLGERLTFEATVAPGETVRTMVGRPDTPEDGLDGLLERPEVGIDSNETDEK